MRAQGSHLVVHQGADLGAQPRCQLELDVVVLVGFDLCETILETLLWLGYFRLDLGDARLESARQRLRQFAFGITADIPRRI